MNGGRLITHTSYLFSLSALLKEGGKGVAPKNRGKDDETNSTHKLEFYLLSRHCALVAVLFVVDPYGR